MPPKNTDTGSLTYNDENAQAHAEMLACLILRSGGESTVISQAERQAMYDRYPEGFGLMALAGLRTGDIQLVVSDNSKEAAMAALLINAQGGKITTDQIPPSFRPRKQGR